MTKNEQILFDLLKAKGRDVKHVWYEPTFGYLPRGWTASILEKDEFDDNILHEYDLGRDFVAAKGQIENNEIKRLYPDDDDDDDDFKPCSACDGHDACADFGCAVDLGLEDLLQNENL